MQNKGFVKVFAVLLTLVCVFYLSFSFVTRYHMDKAAQDPKGDCLLYTSSQQIESAEMLCREKRQKHLPEPIKPQHIKQQMQNACMHEHISQQRPRLLDKLQRPGRQFQIDRKAHV